jgi:TolA-binding protein
MKVIYALIAAGIIALLVFFFSLSNGSLVRYFDNHHNPDRIPRFEYAIGQGYYILGNLDDSATFYYRIVEQYPDSGYAPKAYFNYLQTLEDRHTPHSEMVEHYQKYLDRYPKSEHAEIATKRIENHRNNR